MNEVPVLHKQKHRKLSPVPQTLTHGEATFIPGPEKTPDLHWPQHEP